MRTMMFIALLLVGCFAEERAAIKRVFSPPTTEGGLRRIPELEPQVQKQEPTIPSAAEAAQQQPAQTSQASNCPQLCASYQSHNDECGSMTTSCKRHISKGGSAEADICKNRNTECGKVDTAYAAVRSNRCVCD